jgi:hypothetical protein
MLNDKTILITGGTGVDRGKWKHETEKQPIPLFSDI